MTHPIHELIRRQAEAEYPDTTSKVQKPALMLTPEEAYKCWGRSEYEWPSLPEPRVEWTEFFLQMLRDAARSSPVPPQQAAPVAWMSENGSLMSEKSHAEWIKTIPPGEDFYTIPLYASPVPVEVREQTKGEQP